MPAATPAELALFLGVASVDEDRAALLLGLAEDAATAVLPAGTVLPDAAKGVVLSVAARAFTNPSDASSESVGGVSTGYWHGGGGLSLSRSERRLIQRAAGLGGGAFTVNPAPNAGATYVDPLAPPTLDDAEDWLNAYPDIFQGGAAQ